MQKNQQSAIWRQRNITIMSTLMSLTTTHRVRSVPSPIVIVTQRAKRYFMKMDLLHEINLLTTD